MSSVDKFHSELSTIYGVLMEMKKDVGEINGKLEQVDKRLTEVEKRLDALERKLERGSNKVHIKYFIILVGTILSFLAALYGLHFHVSVPP